MNYTDVTDNKQIIGLLELYALAVEFEVNTSITDKYFNKAAKVLGVDRNKLCSRCGAATQKFHSDIQKGVWNRLVELDERFVPQIELSAPIFKTVYWDRTLKVLSLRDLNAQLQRVSNMTVKYRKSNPKLAELLINDYNTIVAYKKLKFNYFKDFIPTLVEEVTEAEKVALVEDLEAKWKSYTLEDFETDKVKFESQKDAAEAIGVTYANYRRKYSRLVKKEEKKK